MMMQPLLEKLYAMRLGAMAAAWQEQQLDTHIAELSFNERFGLLVDVEHMTRDNRGSSDDSKKPHSGSLPRASRTSRNRRRVV